MGSFLLAIFGAHYFGSVSVLPVSMLLGIKVQHALAKRTACSFQGQVSLDQLLFCVSQRWSSKRLQEAHLGSGVAVK